MKHTTTHTQEVWDSGDFVGEERRPTARATIQKVVAPHVQYRLDDERSVQWAHSGSFSSLMFGQADQKPRELHNVLSIKWSRGVDTDVGSATIVLGNVAARNDLDPASDDELDFPGYYTPNRGTEDYFDRWGYVTNAWRNWLVPDRMIRTYEGYGVDWAVAPELDEHLYPSGTWLIDDVTLSTDGTITLECRDVGRALLDQVVFPPAVPYAVYPLWFDAFTDRAKPQRVLTADGVWQRLRYHKDSNLPYIGSGIRDDGQPIVASDGTVYGHHGRDAFDPATYTYWLSCGKRSRDESDGYEWIQGTLAAAGTVEGVQINAEHGPYRVYISLLDAGGTWLGKKRIPYKAKSVDTGANIKYVAEFSIKKGEIAAFKLPRQYSGIKRIRYTFGDLPWTVHGDRLNHRAAINDVAYAHSVSMETVSGTWKFGNYDDYTTIVKWLLAWAGWFWPAAESGLDVQTYSDGSTYDLSPASVDPHLVDGRAWGDFELTGTHNLEGAEFDYDVWDQKPFMDGIGYIRDIVGFDFWIDETGGAVWRLPNIFDKGCYWMPEKGGPRSTRTTSLLRIDERKHLVDLTVKLSSKSLRERVYVGNSGKHIGAVVKGYRPDYTGLRRYSGWTDQHFATNAECERMADLLALKQSFTYRQNNLTIAANPALQPDDQVLIRERVTGEGYLHRILNISSDFDVESGKWTYTLTTNWLGNEAFTKKAFDPAKMTNATKVYLHAMGKVGF